MRLAATTSLPQVKQCANSAVPSGGSSGESSRAARLWPFCPANCNRSLRMESAPRATRVESATRLGGVSSGVRYSLSSFCQNLM